MFYIILLFEVKMVSFKLGFFVALVVVLNISLSEAGYGNAAGTGYGKSYRGLGGGSGGFGHGGGSGIAGGGFGSGSGSFGNGPGANRAGYLATYGNTFNGGSGGHGK